MQRSNALRFAMSGGFVLVLMLLSLTDGCAHRTNESSTHARFRRLADEFVAKRYALHPIEGVALGWHQYDGRFAVTDQRTILYEIDMLKKFQAAFASLPTNGLSDADRFDLRLIQARIAGTRWGYERQQIFWRNPMAYAGGVSDAPALDVSVYLKRDFKPLSDRVADMTAILRRAPEVVAAARKNLETVLPKPFVETAIESANGTADFLQNDVAKAAATITNTVVLAAFEVVNRQAVAEFRSYADWLKKERLPRADGSFAVGRDAYMAMLKTELIDLTPEQILEIGLRELRAEQQRFTDAAAVIDPSRKAIEVYQAIQHEHPTAASLLPDTRKNLEAIRQFLIDHRIVTVPSEVRPRVEETLPPFRAMSFASMDTPGPFEKKATEAYYYVTPVEPDWTPRQAEEWLSAFNYYELDVTSIHEAYPGHYVQFLALNASAAGTIAKLFGSYPFIEGWAHYSEQMLLDEGYAQPANPTTATQEERVLGAKYRLAQSSDALLRLCRLCCSVKLHCQGMTVNEATHFFMENCYYEEKPAHSEATRGTYDPGYLHYTLGKLMILKLREDWRAQEGPRFSLQRFHDEFLSHGMPPIRLLREIMLQDRSKWAEVL